jgi:hypothetical protein
MVTVCLHLFPGLVISLMAAANWSAVYRLLFRRRSTNAIGGLIDLAQDRWFSLFVGKLEYNICSHQSSPKSIIVFSGFLPYGGFRLINFGVPSISRTRILGFRRSWADPQGKLLPHPTLRSLNSLSGKKTALTLLFFMSGLPTSGLIYSLKCGFLAAIRK